MPVGVPSENAPVHVAGASANLAPEALALPKQPLKLLQLPIPTPVQQTCGFPTPRQSLLPPCPRLRRSGRPARSRQIPRSTRSSRSRSLPSRVVELVGEHHEALGPADGDPSKADAIGEMVDRDGRSGSETA